MAAQIPHSLPKPDKARDHPEEAKRFVIRVILIRVALVLACFNLAHRLGILPDSVGSYSFLPLFNTVILVVTLAYLSLWWSRLAAVVQIRIQALCDLVLASLTVALTGGMDSIFVFLFLLIIVYCALSLGRNGGLIAASLSSIFYAAVALQSLTRRMAAETSLGDLPYLSFRIALHAGSFFAVAWLGAYLSQRLSSVQTQLAEQIHSLRRLEKLNDRIVNSMRNGLVTTALDGAIATFNNAAGEISGWECASAPGTPVAQVLGSELWSEILATDLLAQARPLRSEFWHQSPAGVKRYLGFSVSPLLDEVQQLVGYVIAFQDLTEIKRLEEEVRVRDRMAAIGRMAAGIAHEIRNPLAAMHGSVELLRERVALQPSDARLLDILQRESERLNLFVEKFLCFASPGTYRREPFDLVTLLDDFLAILRSDPEAKRNYTLRLTSSEAPIPIVGNPAQIQQVFWNLAQDAFRAMPGRGELSFHVLRGEDGGVEAWVTAEGARMSEKEPGDLFQPFGTASSGGAGLGPSIVYQIVEDHQGKISVERAEGRGTRVRLRFPPSPRAHAAPETPTNHQKGQPTGAADTRSSEK